MHAYIHANSKKRLDCIYLNEGFAEYGAQVVNNTSGLKPTVSPFQGYDYLGHLITLSRSDLHELFDNLLGLSTLTKFCPKGYSSNLNC